MKLLFDKRDKAEKYPAKKGDTLQSITDDYKSRGGDFPTDLSWEDLALFNWATIVPQEVTRALFERIGIEDPAALQNGLAPETLTLDPALGPDGAKEILVPKLWKAPDGLDLKKTYTLKVRQHIPAVAVSFVDVDKWFIPDVETCEAEYALEGEGDCADHVDCEAYGSNYCKLNAWNDGLPTFTPLPDTPVWKQPESASRAEARSKVTISSWRGLANCSEGLLGPGNPPSIHSLNVAFSPYTIVLRYYKKESSKPDDKTARIELAPFWPRFDATGKVTQDSRKVKWKVRGADRLKFGSLQIVDKEGAIVFAKPLKASDLAKDQEKEFTWDADKDQPSADRMPYRVKIEAHTDIDETEGLAIAVMHTEVRLFVHKDTHPLELDPYVATTDKTSLDLSIADLYHKDEDPQPSEGKLWAKFALAQAGFHPGPVNDGDTNPHFKSALNDFQRSVPKNPAGPAPYERLAITAGDNDDEATNAALAKLSPERRRPWFGKPADRSDWTAQDAAFLAELRDPTKSLILWVDDRNWYTDCKMMQAPHVRTIVINDPADLGNKRDEMNAGDRRVGYDANDIARPWIPLQVDFRLLSKSDSLDDEVAAETDFARALSIQRAIGPLRVDWSFDEIEDTADVEITEDKKKSARALPVLDPAVEAELAALGHRERSRTRIALRWALDKLKAEYARKDIHKTTKYYNARESCGGVRPAAPAQYFSKPFGVEAESLLPYRAKASALETVYTVTHDRLGQPAENFSRKRQGRAGVYFHPSRIAGDGYRVRAQVRFEPEPDHQFPNLAALKDRYPKLPQAQSAALRLWRKTTIRGYISWGPVNSWTAQPVAPRPNLPLKGPDGFRRYYTACHVHVANELGAASADLEFAPADLFNMAEYRTLVQESLTPKEPRREKSWISISPTIWPWSGHVHFGILPSEPGLDIEASRQEMLYNLNTLFDWYSARLALDIAKKIERQTGWMRGHILVEFQCTPPAYYRQYRCQRCNEIRTYLQNAPGPVLAGNRCPKPGCGNKTFSPGRLGALPELRKYFVCDTNPAHRFDSSSGVFKGAPCPTCGKPAKLHAEQVWRRLYQCRSCSYKAGYHEPDAPQKADAHENEPCPCGCGGRMNAIGQELIQGDRIDFLASGPARLIDSKIGGISIPGLPAPSVGQPVGVAFNFLGDSDLWGHEMGHCRYFEHAASAPGSKDKQHDSTANSVVVWQHPNEQTSDKNWDRTCVMSYVTGLNSYDPNKDMPCFCFKCVLKNRGWKLQDATAPVPSPPGDLQDP